jgi:hypothetical protein
MQPKKFDDEQIQQTRIIENIFPSGLQRSCEK